MKITVLQIVKNVKTMVQENVLVPEFNPKQEPNKRNGDPYGIRTRVAGVKGQCPRPLDEGVACLLNRQDCLLDHD